MKCSIYVLAAVLWAIPFAAEASEFVFAAPADGIEVLTREDDYYAALGPADVALRLKSAEPLPVDALWDSYRHGVRAWQEADKTGIEMIIADNRDALEKLSPWLPETVLLVKVTGVVEGGLPHTRSNAIIFPERSLGAPPEDLEKLFFHELFHVLSRSNKDRRDDFYAILGFEPCQGLNLPASLTAKRVTNPDAPDNRHYLTAIWEDETVGLIPYLFAASTTFDSELGDSFGSHFRFGLLVVDPEGQCAARTDDDGAVLVMPEAVPGFFDKIGRNTNYIIHPEEILASNFEFLMIDDMSKLPDPAIPERLGSILSAGPKFAEQ